MARAYVDGNREGQEWVLNHCESHGVALQREDAYTYAQSGKGVASARAELNACQAVGLPAAWDDDAKVPFPYHGGVRLADQAQFDPMPFLDTLRSRGSYVDPRVVTGYEQGLTIAAAARRAQRARHPEAAQEILEKATRLLIRRVAKGDSASRSTALAKSA